MQRRHWLIVACVVAAALGWFWISPDPNEMAFNREMMGFRELSCLADAMCREQAEGVVIDEHGRYIASFEAFFRYVQRRRPDITADSDPTAPNPFPGLLSEKSYGRLAGKAENDSADLFWSNRVFLQAAKARGYQFVLMCDAGEKSLPESSQVRYHSYDYRDARGPAKQ